MKTMIAALAAINAFPLVGVCAQESDRPSVELAVRQKAETFVEAFNKADAESIAALYAVDGRIAVDGEDVAVGRDAIKNTYADIFDEHPGITISVTIESVQLLGPGVVVEKGRSQITSSDEPVADDFTLVHVKQDGRWLTALAEVSQRRVAPEFDWKQELGYFAGKWLAEEGDWRVTTSFEWVAGGSFLKRSFEVTNGGNLESSGVQMIGWDADLGVITSWSFGSDGGHGRGWWSRDEDHWVIHTEGVTAGGERMQATNLITLIGEDGFRWQSTERRINDLELEATPSIRVRRAQQEDNP